MTEQAKAKINAAIARLAPLEADLRAALKALTAAAPVEPPPDEEGPPVEPPDEEGPPVEPPAENGPSGQKKVIGKTFVGRFSPQANTDYIDCKFGGKNERVINGAVPKNVRLIGCTVSDVHLSAGDHVFYINNGHEEKEAGLEFTNLKASNCSTTNLWEIKASDVKIVGCVQDASCKIPQTVRLRHGRKHIIVGNKGFNEISCRGWMKWIIGNPGARVKLYAGNLPARYAQWKDKHVAGGGSNMQCCELAYVAGCGSVQMGYVSQGRKEYPALNNIMHPQQEGVAKGAFKFTLQPIGSEAEPWQAALDDVGDLFRMA